MMEVVHFVLTLLFVFCFCEIQCEKLKIDLPVFDLYEVIHARTSVLEQMDLAAQTYGVFLLCNVTKNLLQYDTAEITDAATTLFSLPESSKLTYTFNATNHFGRGYLSFGAESGLSEVFEPKEGYSYGYPGEHEINKQYGWLTSANLWPSDLPEPSKQILESVHIDFGIVAKLIVQSMIRFYERSNNKAMGLSVEEGAKISLMRLFHYFTVDESILSSSKKTYLGSSPHTDWGLLTVILQSAVSGLQFYHRGEWIDVPNIPDTLIINIGDYFSLASEGRYHSPIHRVLCPTEMNRLSFVYFYYPNFESELIQQKQQGELPEEPNEQNQEDATICNNTDEETCTKDNNNKKDAVHFNTLTISEDEAVEYSPEQGRNAAHSMRFGDYILYKWRSVLRNQA